MRFHSVQIIQMILLDISKYVSYLKPLLESRNARLAWKILIDDEARLSLMVDHVATVENSMLRPRKDLLEELKIFHLKFFES